MAETASPPTAADVLAYRQAVAAEVRAAVGRRRTNATALAKRLGVSQTYVWRRLQGETAFDADDLYRIAALLDVAVADLLPSGGRQGSRVTAGYRERSEWSDDEYPNGRPSAADNSPARPDIDRRPRRRIPHQRSIPGAQLVAA